MGKLIVSEFITIDGVMEDPGGSEKTRNGGWSFQFWNDEAGAYKLNETLSAGALLLGRKTYEAFAETWPSRTDENGFADKMNSMPKYVISETMRSASWNNSTIISNNIIAEITGLKSELPGEILVAGSGQLVNILLQHNLVDELRLMVHPVILGEGKKLFSSKNEKQALKLIDTKIFATGTIVLIYGPAV